MPITQRDADIMQVEAEFKIQQILRGWQRSFLSGRTGQAFPQQQSAAPAPEQGPEVAQQAPRVKEVLDGS